MTGKARNARYRDLLSRLFDLAEAPLDFGAVSPGIALETEDAQELDQLRGWRRYGQVFSQAAGVGQLNEFLIDNPASSRTLVRIEMLSVSNDTVADQFIMGFTSGVNTGTYTNQGGGGPLDARNRIVGGFQRSAVTLFTKNTAALTASSRWTILKTSVAMAGTFLYASRAEARAVIDPGSQLLVGSGIVNTTARVGLVWCERPFDPQEKYPVL